MTRKDYILLAEALRVQRFRASDNSHAFRCSSEPAIAYDSQVVGIDNATCEIADALKRDNPRFNREHFLAVVRGEKPLESRPPRS